MSFDQYPLDDFHLYISKRTQERLQIRQKLLPVFVKVDRDINFHGHYSKDSYLALTTTFLQRALSEITIEDLPIVYGIVDFLLLTPNVLSLNLDDFAQGMVRVMASFLPPFPILHELAVLSWYDQIVSVEIFLEILDQYELKEKEAYHILGELSHRYPEETIEFALSRNVLGSHYLPRLKTKMQTIRNKGSKKDFELVGNSEEIEALWTKFSKKI
ncbi:MAG: hypothetical protein D6732_02530 [Methanobacteriota archaeon]|nr:MAG: hypothetical protein D6732_02530 [Euryarchaeota archaeon]